MKLKFSSLPTGEVIITRPGGQSLTIPIKARPAGLTGQMHAAFPEPQPLMQSTSKGPVPVPVDPKVMQEYNNRLNAIFYASFMPDVVETARPSFTAARAVWSKYGEDLIAEFVAGHWTDTDLRAIGTAAQALTKTVKSDPSGN